MQRQDLQTSILLPDDVAALRTLIEQREAELVVIDPLMAHLAAVDSWNGLVIPGDGVDQRDRDVAIRGR